MSYHGFLSKPNKPTELVIVYFLSADRECLLRSLYCSTPVLLSQHITQRTLSFFFLSQEGSSKARVRVGGAGGTITPQLWRCQG